MWNKCRIKSVTLISILSIVVFCCLSEKPQAVSEKSTSLKENLSLKENKDRVLLLNVAGAISPASEDYILKGLQEADKIKAKLVILQLDTPGGLETSMRTINRGILASNIPVVAFVAPRGARAASAGTYILYASHIAAMAEGTNLGAATPVSIGGKTESPIEKNDQYNNQSDDKTAKSTKSDKLEKSEKSDDKLKYKSEKGEKKEKDTMARKAEEDDAAYIRSLAQMNHRNVTWAERAVRESVSLSADEALKLNVINVIANTVPELLQALNGYAVKVQGKEFKLDTLDLVVDQFEPDWRYELLSLITDPTVAYILLMIGIYGLFFEFSNPGFILPGVAGGIALLLALYAFHLLPINYAGVALLLLGISCMIAEAYVSSFGALGIGGVIAFALGSLLLLDIHVEGFGIAWQVILLMSLLSLAFFLTVINLTILSMRKKIVTGKEALIGSVGEVMETQDHHAIVRIQGEIWQADSLDPLTVGQKIRVTAVSGLRLTVEKIGR